MKKLLYLLVILCSFTLIVSVSSSSKKVYVHQYKPSKHHKKSQSYNNIKSDSSLDQDTKKMLEDLYHRYSRGYSRVYPERIEKDDFGYTPICNTRRKKSYNH